MALSSLHYSMSITYINGYVHGNIGQISLRPAAGCAIWIIKKGKPETHGLPLQSTAYILQAVAIGGSGGYFLPLNISYMRLTRATMNIPIWIKSEYVTYISNRPPFSRPEGLPLRLWRVGRLFCVPTFRIANIADSKRIHKSLFCQRVTPAPSPPPSPHGSASYQTPAAPHLPVSPAGRSPCSPGSRLPRPGFPGGG